MAWLVGQLVGGFIINLLLAVVLEKLLFSRIYDDPVKGELSSVGAAWLVSSAVAGFGMADGGPYAWRAFLIYLPPALVLAALAWRRGLQLREEVAGSALP